ncbi:hypothetical protein KJ903_02040 [Patescibacteria group bacterium]|nr:hypothetical protein [Patescibacteria group bacterium]
MSKADSQKIVSEIKEKNIKPESKLKLNWKNYILWGALGIVIILGALVCSLAMLDIADTNLKLYKGLGFMKFIRIFVTTAPYLLIALAALMLGLGVLSWRQTRRGYRHSIVVVAGIIVLIVTALGILGHLAQVNRRLEKDFVGQFPQLRGPAKFEEGRWLQPEQGLLGGEAIVVITERIDLRDFADKDWQIYYSEETHIRPGYFPRVGERIGVMGEVKGESEFTAYVIRPLPAMDKKLWWKPGQRPGGY